LHRSLVVILKLWDISSWPLAARDSKFQPTKAPHGMSKASTSIISTPFRLTWHAAPSSRSLRRPQRNYFVPPATVLNGPNLPQRRGLETTSRLLSDPLDSLWPAVPTDFPV